MTYDPFKDYNPDHTQIGLKNFFKGRITKIELTLGMVVILGVIAIRVLLA
jgi:hypothetical protein